MEQEYHWSNGLFDSPIEKVVYGWTDPYADYSFSMTDLVRVDGQWYVVGTGGCSCPTPEENAGIEKGPDSIANLRAWFEAEYQNVLVGHHYEEDGYAKDMLNAFDKAASAV